MTSQPDSEHYAADSVGIGDHNSADQRDERDLYPEARPVPEALSAPQARPVPDARPVPQAEVQSDESVEFDPVVRDTRDADPDAETAGVDSDSEPLVAEATVVDQEADSAHPAPGAEWHDIQAMFVDNPRQSVQFAADKADAAVSALAELLQQRRSALGTTTAGSSEVPAETEELRELLRSYRIFCQSISDLGGQIQEPAATTR